MITFRDTLLRVVPRWLRGHWGSRYLYAIGIHLDTVAEAATAAVKLRFPGVYSPEGLGLLGKERGIMRGIAETDEAYAYRLSRWWDDRKRKGNAFALAFQLQGILGPHRPRIRVVNQSGSWYTLNEDGSTAVHNAAWDWDGNVNAWSRFWVIIYPPPELWVSEGTWGDGKTRWGDGGTWGTTATPAQCAMVRALITEWQAAHARCAKIIIALDPASFDPETTPASELPDGKWGRWSKDDGTGARVPARLKTARYWKGS